MTELNYYYVYILECADNDYYVGRTRDLIGRVVDHGLGNGAEKTKKSGFKRLLYFEKQKDEKEAVNREIEIKNKGRSYQNMLVREFQKNLLLLKY